MIRSSSTLEENPAAEDAARGAGGQDNNRSGSSNSKRRGRKQATANGRDQQARVERQLRDAGIVQASYKPGKYDVVCPQCSGWRKKGHQQQKKLNVKIDDKGVCWNCNHCGWSGPERGKGKNWRAAHDYHDADGRYLYTKVRYPSDHDPKCRLGRRGGSAWAWGAGKAARVLYRLPDVNVAIDAARLVVVAEGESDADALRVGLVATCSRDGCAPRAKLSDRGA
jgi:hypothetical protein